jgi:hypothetical protein
MSLLPGMLLYLTVGCGEWYLALRRTLACARGEKAVLVTIVFIENLLGLWVLSNFVRTNNWLLALSYATGASAGALIMTLDDPKKGAIKAFGFRLFHFVRASTRSFIPAVLERAGRLLRHRDYPPFRRGLGCIEHPGSS